MRLGIAAFLIPFAFVLNEGLLMRGSVAAVSLAVVTAVLGATALATAIRGYAISRLGSLQRALAFAGGLLLIGPGLHYPLAGLGLFGIAILPQVVMTVRGRKAV